MPALNAAIEALSQLSKGDIVEVNAMKKPPGGVVLVSKALCWCFGIKPKKVPSPDGKGKIDDYWDPSKKAQRPSLYIFICHSAYMRGALE